MAKKIRRQMLMLGLLLAMLVTSIQLHPVSAAAISRPKAKVSKRTTTTATLQINKVSGATGYHIYVATSRKGKYSQIGATRTQSFKLTKIKKTKEYYVKVRAYKTSGLQIYKSKLSKAIKINKYETKVASDQYEQQVLDLVNEERKKEGQPALKLKAELTKVAEIRAKELATNYSHTRPDGRDCFTALKDADLSYSSVGENIATGPTSPATVVKAWMSSEGHKANILLPDYESMGLGYYSKGNKTYWCQVFIKE